jgi:hypothetical protein
MANKKNIKTTKECFDIILKGNKKDSHVARLSLRKIVYSNYKTSEYKVIVRIVKDALRIYEKIDEEWRQENFIVALSTIYFLRDYKKYPPDHLFPLFLGLLQHSNGNIRYATVRMLRDEIIFLSIYLRLPEEEKKGDRQRKLEFDHILYWLYVGLIRLSDVIETWKKVDYEKYKYIDEIPSSSYKSVQMVIANMIEFCGEENIEAMNREMTLRGDDVN